MLDKEFREKLIVKILKATASAGEKDVEKALSAKARSVAKALKDYLAGNGANAPYVTYQVETFKALLGEDISPLVKPIPAAVAPPMSAVMVLDQAANGCTYPVNTIAVLPGKGAKLGGNDIGIGHDGLPGNHLPLDKKAAWRFATPEEIKKMSDKQLTGVAVYDI